jgi:hypothetical protein
MRGAALVSALAESCCHPALAGLEIVEYNPYRDHQAATAGLVGDALVAILAGQTSLAVEHGSDPPPEGDGIQFADAR